MKKGSKASKKMTTGEPAKSAIENDIDFGYELAQLYMVSYHICMELSGPALVKPMHALLQSSLNILQNSQIFYG